MSLNTIGSDQEREGWREWKDGATLTLKRAWHWVIYLLWYILLVQHPVTFGMIHRRTITIMLKTWNVDCAPAGAARGVLS